MEQERYIIAALVSNQAGVLTRVSGMFTRRGFNIDSLTVGETETAELSRITISIRGDKHVRDQIVGQLKKLHDVREVSVLSQDITVVRELMLVKVKNATQTRQDILSAVDIFRSKIVDYSPDAITIELTGETTKLDAFLALVQPFGILEICRTGIVAMSRGGNCLNAQPHTDAVLI